MSSSRRISRQTPASLDREIARAFAITPPPDDPETESDDKFRLHTTLPLHGRCLLQISGTLRSIQEDVSNLHTQRANASSQGSGQSPSYQSWYDEFQGQIDGVKETLNTIDTNVDENSAVIGNIENQLRTLTDESVDLRGEVAELQEDVTKFRKDVQAEFVDVRVEISALRTELRTEISALRTEMSALRAEMRNGLLSRFIDIVIPLASSSKVQQGKKRTVAWYWRLQREKRLEELIVQHQVYDIKPEDWLVNPYNLDSDSDSDSESDDPDDLDRSIAPPVTLEDAIRQHTSEAVRVLFAHLGIRYDHFKDLDQRHHKRGPPAASKRKSSYEQEGRSRRSPARTTESGSGSTTQAFSSPRGPRR